MLRKPLTTTVMIAALLVGLLAMHGWASESDQELEQKVEQLSKTVGKLEEMVKDLSFQLQQAQSVNNVVKELSFDLKKAQSDIKDLESVSQQVDEIKPQIASINSTIQGMGVSFKEKLKTVQGRVFDLETTVQGLDARVKSVEGKVRKLLGLQKHVNDLQDQVGSLQERLNKLAEAPTGPKGAMKLTERIEGLRLQLSSQVSKLSDRVKALEDRVAGLPVDELQQGVQQNRERITSLEGSTAGASEVNALQARVSQLEEQVGQQVQSVKSQSDTNTIVAALGLIAGLAALATSFGFF